MVMERHDCQGTLFYEKQAGLFHEFPSKATELLALPKCRDQTPNLLHNFHTYKEIKQRSTVMSTAYNDKFVFKFLFI